MLRALLKTVTLLIAIAYYTLAERKIMGSAQRRYGPNVVGLWGLLQPLADGLKLMAKELVIPSHANNRIFILAPLAVFMLTLLSWSVIPLDCVDLCYAEYDIIPTPFGAADLRYGLLAILAISSFSVYWIALAGWASNSKYAFLGSLRSAAQMISYEVAVSLTLLPVVAMAGSMNLSEIVVAQTVTLWFVFPLLPTALIFAISMIAETNRTPFDLPEAEAELVAGYNVEYSSITFAMFFLAEYGNMILAAVIYAIFFFGGGALVFKALVFCFLFVLVRATLPRYRYDQLMDIGWKIFLPTATAYFLLILNLLYTFKASPCCTWLT